MLMNYKLLSAILLPSFFSGSCASIENSSDIYTASVCDIASNYKKYEKKRIYLSSKVITDLSHNSVLTDDNCLGEYIVADFEGEAKNPSVDDFWKEMYSNISDLSARRYEIYLTGTFRLFDGKGVLVIEEVIEYKKI